MDNKKNGIPKLRFPGFTGAWEQRKLGEVAEINPSSEIPDNFEYVDLESVVGTEMIAYRRENKKTAPSRAQRLAKKGDIFYQTVRPYQKNNYHFNLTRKDFVFSTGYAQLRPNINGDFLFVYIQLSNFVNEVLNRSTGTSYPAISPSNLIRMKVAIPTNNEQEKIGAFFKQLDSLIALHQRKLEHLQEQKKGLLQKMFPKNGENVPEVRFPGFTDAWEQRKLGEVADIFDGTHQTPKYTDSGIKFVSVENIATLETEKYISQKAYESEYSNKQAEKGDVLMTRIGNIGTPKLIEKDEPLAYYVTLALLKPKNIDSNFLAWGISSPKVQRNIWKLTLHIAFPKKINLGEINQVSISIPSINEQKKIGDFFKQLDSLIALHQRKLDHLELMKKGLLQQMFV